MGKEIFSINDPAQLHLFQWDASEYEFYSNGVNAIDILSMMSHFL